MKRIISLITLVLLAGTLNWLIPMQAANASAADTDSALVLNGTSQDVYASDTSQLVTNAFTVEAWINRSATCSDTSLCHYVAKENSYVFAINNGYLSYALMGTGGNWYWQSSGYYVPFNTWVHLAFVRAASTNTMTLYVNGQIYSSSLNVDQLGTGVFYASTNPVIIGARYIGPSPATCCWFAGQIDEVKIWNVTRTQGQVQSDLSSYGPTNGSGLVAYWDFNDAATSTNKSTNSSKMGDLSTAVGNPTIQDVKVIDTSTSSGYTIIKFPRSYLNSSGGWAPPVGITNVTAVVVGGGGGGTSQTDKTGWVGGGGGAGGYQNVSTNVSASNFYQVTVGQGGLGGITVGTTSSALGQNGGASTFSSLTSQGGGSGGGQSANSVQNGASGGSGGGGGTYGGSGGTGTSGQGFNGGASTSTSGHCCNSGGGGGSASVGGDGDGTGTVGGIGGNGTVNPFFALPAYLAAGGNGLGGTSSNYVSQTGGTAGQASTGGSPSTNTGSGGGGGGGGTTFVAAGNGASGIVMIKYKNQFATSISISVSPKKTTKNSAATPITAVTTSSGTVTFYANGRVINGCNGVVVSGTTATCNWRPITQGQVTLTATYTSTDSLYSGSASSPAYVTTVGKRTTAR